ncbi:uncharacterized protein B0I36DRAFT_338375 [Microdochium trichocladiopsis]|uniref:Uncharacterized protein n=1 Tax=Microdochium trichocladiopsis TaxID=1682393 RepID=A0A9P9BIB4_9PEZI|nr:uncharacterized protein B0I36DRAFT_338375 [Microdochium trichocladiopsis]KAH7014190.1 hypothetical protein B0I36DRAFT_338375 [Microdochium trichocladiopsis]
MMVTSLSPPSPSRPMITRIREPLTAQSRLSPPAPRSLTHPLAYPCQRLGHPWRIVRHCHRG